MSFKENCMKKEPVTLRMSVGAYLSYEETSEIRHEYINGELIPMPGTTLAHNLICGNLHFLLRTLLKTQGPWLILVENVKARILSDSDYTYPDVMLTNHPDDFKSKYIVQFPSVIFEVMSKISRTEDAVDKFIRYKNIETLRNYILIDSEKRFAEVRTKQENGDWYSETYLPSDGALSIPVLNLELPFDGVYEGLDIQ